MVVAVVVAISVLGVHLSMLVASYLYKVVPVHDWPYLVFQSVLLLDLLAWSCDDTLILNFLTRSLRTIVQQ